MLTVNLVVDYPVQIHTLQSFQFFLKSYDFYHPGKDNIMADDASSLFSLSEIDFIYQISSSHPQPQMILCVKSALCRRPCMQELHKIRNLRLFRQWS